MLAYLASREPADVLDNDGMTFPILPVGTRLHGIMVAG